MKDAEERVIREITVISPENSTSWVGLAAYLANEEKQLDEALLAVQKATAIAIQKGVLIRYAHNAQARIAKKLCDYELLEKTIEFLISYKPINTHDIGYEKDFLINLPDGVINEELLKKYHIVCGS